VIIFFNIGISTQRVQIASYQISAQQMDRSHIFPNGIHVQDQQRFYINLIINMQLENLIAVVERHYNSSDNGSITCI
jgi:hypothetical protein